MLFLFCNQLLYIFSDINPRHKVNEDNEMKQLREENSRLRTQIDVLSSQENGKDLTCDITKYGEIKLELIQTKQDLNRAKEALQGELNREPVETG